MAECQRQADGHGGACSQARKTYLYAHGECHLMTGEPFHHDLRDGDAAHLIAHAENGKAQCRVDDLLFEHHVGKPQQGKIDVRGGIGRDECDGIIHHQYTGNHQRASQYAREADAHLVENQSAEEQHQEKDVDESVGAGEESVLRARPVHATTGYRRFEE